jgi:large subunit ribosomal protein L30
MATIKVKAIRSRINCPKTEKLTLDALGLTRIGLVRELPDNESTRGQIRKVAHLVALVD